MVERSAGSVLYNEQDGTIEYLLLHYPAGHWDFPKGNIEEGENDLDTVRREVREETSIENIEFVNGFKKKIMYKYKRNGRLVSKEVTFYLSRTNSRKVTLSWEHQGYRWANYEDAIHLLTYNNAKMVLRDANVHLTQK